MTKRRFVTLLPSYLQTDDHQKFFSATVDHLFQPGVAEQISGYIGQRPSYTDDAKDFYINEPTASRDGHQLEPVMVQRSESAIERVLFYTDFVNHIRANGGITDNETRLFEGDYYTWAPPIDIDKLNNPQNYFWFGDVDNLPALVLKSPSVTYIADGAGIYALPPTIPGFDVESPFVFVDGVKVEDVVRNGNNVVILPVPANGQVVEVIRYGDLKTLIEGKTNIDLTTLFDADLSREKSGMAADHFIDTVSSLTTGMRVIFRDGIRREGGTIVDSYMVDGVGSAITLTDHTSVPVSEPTYCVMDRRAKNRNPWSRANMWVHRSALRWTGLLFSNLAAKRPIIDFAHDLELYRYGRVADGVVACVISSAPRLGGGWDSNEFDPIIGTMYEIEEGFLTGLGEWDYPQPINPLNINGKPPGSVVGDDNRSFGIGDRIVLAMEVPDHPELTNVVCRIDAAIGSSGAVMVLVPEGPATFGQTVTLGDTASTVWEEGTPPSLLMPFVQQIDTPENVFPIWSTLVVKVDGVVTKDFTREGSLITLNEAPLTTTAVISASVELAGGVYWNGIAWQKTVNFREGSPPLFALYDIDGTALDDPGVYPQSDFTGSRLFGAAVGTGTPDAVLGQPLRYDTYGQIVFENDISTRRYTYALGNDAPTINGFYFYKHLANDELLDRFANDWHLAPQASVHDQIAAEVPKNLSANPNNQNVDFVSRNEWFDHFSSILSNQPGFEGEVFGENNWRDSARDLSLGQRILQHRSPMLKSMLIASDSSFDLLDSIRYAETEYGRFRGRFIQTVTDFYLNGRISSSATYDQWVVSVLNSMKANKTVDFPFAYSDAAGGQFFIPPTPSVLGIAQCVVPQVIIDASFGAPVKFLLGHDGSRLPLFGEVKAYTYEGGPAAFALDEEPLGEVIVSLNGTPTTAFRMHGRIVELTTPPTVGTAVTLEVNDIRDLVNLALEQRIYTNIDQKFRDQDHLGYDFTAPVQGKFRRYEHAYTREEITRVMTPSFLRWAHVNQFDYQANDGYVASDPFTYNYSRSVDVNGDSLPGHWRGIYRWYFDTDRPNETPWRMVGFAARPSWWVAEYGNAPYLRSNNKLWSDMSAGLVRQGARAGVDARYIRPNLMQYLPVGPSGELLDPMAAGIVAQAPIFQNASRGWAFGDGAPVEALWRDSPGYRFAECVASYLTKPARFVEHGWDTLNVSLVHVDQYIYLLTGDRPMNSEYAIHGELRDNGEVVKVTGIQQWIFDHMLSKGQSVSTFANAVRGLDAQLAHKMAGFTTVGSMRVIADNFGLVPEEDISAVLYTSPSFRNEFYSGVIVEWTGSGWAVYGYDSLDPNFGVIPADTAGPRVVVSITDVPEPVIVQWRPNTFYTLNTLVKYRESVYQAIKSHTSTSTFTLDMDEFWAARPGIMQPSAPRVTKYLTGRDVVETVPYGTEFKDYQTLADFMFGYERYLESRGWVFDATEENDVAADWTTSVREFLEWSQYTWEPGNFIALSPGADRLHFHADHGMVYSLEQAFSGSYGIVNRAGMPINRRDTFVTRVDGDVVITTNSDLYGVRLNVGEIEHVLVFQNTTIFNDIIYKPLFDLRQPRLRLLGQRTRDWTGRLDAPGYVLIDNEIKPNFERASENIREMFDIEGPEHGELRDHARHLIGYETRSYLENLLLSDVQQFEFYQGMVQQKGAPGIFEKMLRSQFVDQNRSLQFLEEWAFKLGAFGATESRQTVSFELRQSDIQRNPQLVRFDPETPDSDALHIWGDRFVSPPPNPYDFFVRRYDLLAFPEGLPSAGYARLTEVDYTALRLTDLAGVYADDMYDPSKIPLALGSRVWVYENGPNDWQVLRVTNMNDHDQTNPILRFDRDDDTLDTRVYFGKPPGLVTADIGKYMIVSGKSRTDQEIEGVHEITGFGSDWVSIAANINEGYRWVDNGDGDHLPTADDPENGPVAYILRNVRFSQQTDLDTAYWFKPDVGELAYVDRTPLRGWRVMRWNGTYWDVYRTQPNKMDSTRILSSLIYETDSEILNNHLLVEPLRLSGLLVYDPIAGLIAGQAERELTYKLEYDPAEYATEGWAKEHEGQLWWNLSTTRFLEAETDSVVGNTERGNDEMEYRIAHWGKLAPKASIDIYEWTRSLVPPQSWNREGQPYMGVDAPYVEVQEYEPSLDRLVTVYYFWVKGSTVIPRANSDRKLDAAQVARMIESPTAFDIPWIAPVGLNSMLVSGVAQHLRETNSIFQIEIRALDYDGVVHHEWELLRNGDERSQPSQYLWDRLIDSVSGFNYQKESVPDDTLHESARQGLLTRPRQSLFGGTKNPRAAILAARESFLGVVNNILSRSNVVQDRANIEELFSEQHTVSDKMIWSGEESNAGNLPSPLLYSHTVFTMAARNQLLLDPVFRSAKRRVLVNRLSDTPPQWSVWQYDPATDPFDDNEMDRLDAADTLFTLATTWDIRVADRAARNALLEDAPVHGTIVYVEHDSAADGFWTTWIYSPPNPASDENGFVLADAQDYRLTDFWDLTDWFTEGYSAERPPVVEYDTVLERNLAENPNPRTTFVRINDDGFGKWMWTAYEDDKWIIVAREKGTIAFKSFFYDPTRPIFNVGARVLADVPFRDGTFELRALLRILRSGAFTDAELNEVFFSMVNFAHSYLDQINWAFKTSFLYIGGYNERLIQSAIQTADNTESLLSYIEEVKPYRVKIREFARVLTADPETAMVHASDFDKPLYFDPVLNRYRRLGRTTDETILSTVQPWKDWYDNLNKTGYDLETYNATTWNPHRRPKISLLFDRIDGIAGIPLETDMGVGWDVDPWENADGELTPISFGFTSSLGDWDNNSQFSGAAQRILDYYTPSPTMPEKSLKTLLNLEFGSNRQAPGKRGNELDGSKIINRPTLDRHLSDEGPPFDLLINPLVGDQPGLRVNDPGMRQDRPEELVYAGHTDHVALTVRSQGIPGAPIQNVKFFDVRDETDNFATLVYGVVGQSSDGIIVYRDGIRAEPTDYSIDHFKRAVTVSLEHEDMSRVQRVTIRVVGTGGTSKILEQRFFDYFDGEPTSFQVNSQVGTPEVIVNGAPVGASLADGLVTVYTILDEGDDILVNIRETAGSGIFIRAENLTWNASQEWVLADLTTPARPWAHSLSIVEVDGLRLRPKETHTFSLSRQRSVAFESSPTSSQVKIYLNGVLYMGIIEPAVPGTTSIEEIITDTSSYTGKFVLWNDNLICVDPLLGSDTVIVVDNPAKDEFTLDAAGNLIILKPVDPTASIRVTTFRNSTSMQIETVVFNGNSNGTYPLALVNRDYVWVTINGRYQTAGVDFDLSSEIGALSPLLTGWDVTAWDDGDEWDAADAPTTGIRFGSSHLSDDVVIVTCFRGAPLKLPSAFQASTVRPGKSLMVGIMAGDWDVYPWDDDGHRPLDEDVGLDLETLGPDAHTVNGYAGWDEGDQFETSMSSLGIRTIHTMEQGWEYFRVSERNIGKLSSAVTPTSTEMTVVFDAHAEDIFTMKPFRAPQPDAPGVAWLAGERVEYSDMTQVGTTVTLKGLARGSKGTHIGVENRNIALVPTVGGQTDYLFNWSDTTGLTINIVDVNGVSIAASGYVITDNGPSFTISFAEALPVGHFVSVIQSLNTFTHEASTEVRGYVEHFQPNNRAL